MSKLDISFRTRSIQKNAHPEKFDELLQMVKKGITLIEGKARFGSAEEGFQFIYAYAVARDIAFLEVHLEKLADYRITADHMHQCLSYTQYFEKLERKEGVEPGMFKSAELKRITLDENIALFSLLTSAHPDFKKNEKPGM